MSRFLNLDFIHTGTKNVTLAGTAEVLGSRPIQNGLPLCIKAKSTNTGYIYVAGNETDANLAANRITLRANEPHTFQASNLSSIWINSSVSGEGVEWSEGEFSPTALNEITIEEADIQIGAIEIKNADSDVRAVVSASTDNLADGNKLITGSILYGLDEDGTYDRLKVDNDANLKVNVTNRVDSVITDGNAFVQIPTDGGTAKTTGIHALGTDGTLAQIIKTDSNGELQVDVLTTSLDGAVYADDDDWTDSSSEHVLVGGLYQSVPQTVTDGDVAPFEIDVNGKIIESNSNAIKTALEIIDDWDDSNYCNVNLNIAGTDVSANSGALTAQTLRVALATDDPQLGAVGAAADADGSLHAQLYYANNTLDSIDTNTEGVAIPTTITSGVKTVTVAGTAEAIAGSTACKAVSITANLANTGYIYVGGSTVDKDSNPGKVLVAGDSYSFPITNLSVVYIDASVGGEGVSFNYFT